MILGVPPQIGYTLLGALIFGEAAGLPIPGETALLPAGAAAAASRLRDDPGARHRPRAVERADGFFARHGSAAVFIGRWIPGVRYMAALMGGATRMALEGFAGGHAAGAGRLG